MNVSIRFPTSLKLTLVVLSLGKLWLVNAQALLVISHAAYDDRLFVTHAASLLSGAWFGPYDQFTLAKGPFYPIWIALAFLSGIPLLLAQHLLYIAACLVFIRSVRPLFTSSLQVMFVFALLLMNPMTYTEHMLRVIREGIYPAETLLVIATGIGCYLRVGGTIRTLAAWSTAFGLALSAFWLTREEGIWIMPGVLGILLLVGIRTWPKWKGQWPKIFLLWVWPFLIWVGALSGVASVVQAHYGVFTTVEYKEDNFVSAYRALLRIKHERPRFHVPVPKEVREKVYTVSPSFAELRYFLEGPDGQRWFSPSCSTVRVCDDEISGAYFMWALRDAVASAGHCLSGATASAYYKRLADEVNVACQSKRLDCLATPPTMMPPWHWEHTGYLVRTVLAAIGFVVEFQGLNVESPLSIGPRPFLSLFQDLTRERVLLLRLRGWAFSPDQSVELTIETNERFPIEELEMQVSEGVYEHFLRAGQNVANARQARFDTVTACNKSCFLNVKSGNGSLARLPLDGSVMSLQTQQLVVHLDYLYWGTDGLDQSTFQARMDRLKLKFLTIVSLGYQKVIPLLSASALFLYLANAVVGFKRRTTTEVFLVSTVILICIGARIVFNSLVEITSFPAINTGYLAAVYPLLLIFCSFSLYGHIAELHSDVLTTRTAIERRERAI